jgi:alkylated DNA repair dioxygenase AlkB
MPVGLQGSLFGETAEAKVGPLSGIRRTPLSHGAWIDVLPNWLTGADTLFERLAELVPWHAERRRMYDRVVDVPRLLCFYDEHDELPDSVLSTARSALSRHYAKELGEPFRTAGLCFYRDGRDSVAWHGDTIGRSAREDTMVAILSIGAPRTLLLRPLRDGGGTVRQLLGPGDLIVMGGSCQRTWQHAVPKTGKPVGPRISIQFRPHAVR